MERAGLEKVADQVYACASVEAQFYECEVITLTVAQDGTFTLRAGGVDLNTLVGILSRATTAAASFGAVDARQREQTVPASVVGASS